MYLAIASKQLNAFWNECLASIKDNANTISPNRIGVRAYSIHTHRLGGKKALAAASHLNTQSKTNEPGKHIHFHTLFDCAMCIQLIPFYLHIHQTKPKPNEKQNSFVFKVCMRFVDLEIKNSYREVHFFLARLQKPSTSPGPSQCFICVYLIYWCAVNAIENMISLFTHITSL